MNKLKKIIKKYEEIISYVFFGALTTVVSLGTYYLCVLTIFNPKNALLLQCANIISWIASVTFAYFTNRKYVFKSKENNKLKEATKFYGSRIATLVMDMALMFLFVSILRINDKIAKLIVQIFIVIGNYIISKFFVFSKRNKKVMFIASTGGHLNELLQLKPLIEKYNSCLITEKTKSNMNLKNKYDRVYYLVYGTRHYKFSYMFKFLYNILKSFVLYIKERPNVIITTGTHTAVPMCYFGKIFGSKVIFIETFANSKTKTLSGRLVYPIADTFIVQWKEMLQLYPKAIYGGWIY